MILKSPSRKGNCFRGFDEQEVLDSIKLSATDKAPGPYGFNMVFCTRCWDIINTHIMLAIKNFHSLEFFEKIFNAKTGIEHFRKKKKNPN